MPFEKNYGLPEAVKHAPCINIRSKAIYVTGQLRIPDHPDEEGCNDCWCNQTQHILGPDQQDVNMTSCSPTRDCYRDSH